MSTTLQSRDIRLTTEQAENCSKTLLNLMRDGESEIVGAGMRHPFPEMIDAIKAAERERKKDEEKRHSATINALQQRIQELQDLIDDYNRQIEDVNNVIRSADRAITALQEDGLPEMDNSGRFKDSTLERAFYNWEQKNGKVDRTDNVALLAAITDMRNNHEIWRDELEFHRDQAQNQLDQAQDALDRGDYDEMDKVLESTNHIQLMEVRMGDQDNPDLLEEVRNEYNGRMTQGKSQVSSAQETDADDLDNAFGALMAQVDTSPVADAVLPGSGIKSETLPELRNDFVAAHDHVSKENEIHVQADHTNSQELIIDMGMS